MKKYTILFTKSELKRMLKVLDKNGGEVLFSSVEKIKGEDQMFSHSTTRALAERNLTDEQYAELRDEFWNEYIEG